MKFFKRIEKSGKRILRSVTGGFFKPVPVGRDAFDAGSVSKILVVRQDSRLGNLVLLTPLLSVLREAFISARLDILISEGFEDILEGHPAIDRQVVFYKRSSRFTPWVYPLFIRRIRHERYDMAIDVSDGHHFSFNNVLLTALSGARYRVGYDREDAESYLNIVLPKPPVNTHMADAVQGLAKHLVPNVPDYPMSFHISEDDRTFARSWLRECEIEGLDSFFVLHPGGRGKKQWGADNFSDLIDSIAAKTGVRIVVIGGCAEDEIIDEISNYSKTPFEILQDVSVGQMAAVIERCDMFISNDTGPMHVSSALGRPTIGIFLTSNYRVYGPRGKNGRIVAGQDRKPSVDDVMMAVEDLIKQHSGMS